MFTWSRARGPKTANTTVNNTLCAQEGVKPRDSVVDNWLIRGNHLADIGADLLQIGQRIAIAHIDQRVQHLLPQLHLQKRVECVGYGVRSQTAGRLLAHVHVLAAQQRVYRAGHAEQVDLVLPRPLLQHFGAHKVLGVQRGGERLIGREEVQVDGAPKVDQFNEHFAVAVAQSKRNGEREVKQWIGRGNLLKNSVRVGLAHLPFHQQKVVGLDVRMDDVGRMQVIQNEQHLLGQDHDDDLVDGPARELLVAIANVKQRAIFTEIGNVNARIVADERMLDLKESR